jgi:hypothetical protein
MQTFGFDEETTAGSDCISINAKLGNLRSTPTFQRFIAPHDNRTLWNESINDEL